MRIALLTTALARGGAESQVAQLAAGLIRAGEDVSIISLTEPEAFTDVAPVYSLHMRPGEANPAALVRLAVLLRRLRPHVVHAHMFHANLMARIIRMVVPAPVICTLHSVAESPRSGGGTRKRDLAYRITDPLAAVTVAVSHAVAERHATAKAVRGGKVRVIPNGVDTSRFHPDPAARERVRQELQLGDEFVWLAAGRLMWKKDYPTLLAAFARTAGVLLIAGEGPLEAELRAAAPPGVQFLGSRNDMPALMQAADAFVLSSVVEGLPVALLEAAASGLPCVATNAGGVREVVPATFLVPPSDPAALADAMLFVMGMPEDERRAVGEAMRVVALAEHDMDKIVFRWLALYREVAGEAAAHLAEDEPLSEEAG
jgi:glycosyltransferase involved in cell wall biosynthesis